MNLFSKARRNRPPQTRIAPGHSTDGKWLEKIIVDSTKQRNMLRPFVKEFCDLMFRHDVYYVADFGTLVGAVRDGREILWDDDYDFFVLDEDLSVLIQALSDRPMFVHLGVRYYFTLEQNPQGYLSVLAIPVDSTQPKARIADLFYQSDKSNWLHPQEEDMFPINRIPFEGMIMNVMENPDPYLNRIYGPNWRTEYLSPKGL